MLTVVVLITRFMIRLLEQENRARNDAEYVTVTCRSTCMSGALVRCDVTSLGDTRPKPSGSVADRFSHL